jgi:hypothetical protein
MIMIKKGLLATAAAMTLGFGAMGSAHAATHATAILDIQNFTLRNADGSLFGPGAFSVLTGTNDAHATAALNGVFANAADSVPISAAGGPNLAQQCVGTCMPIGADVYAGLPSLAGNYGHADQNLTGSAIVAGGARAQTRADAATNDNFNVASGNSDVGTSTSFQFAFTGNTTMRVDFSAFAFTEAHVDPGSSPVANANARLSWSMNIIDTTTGSTVFTLEPDALNELSLRSATHASAGTATYNPGIINVVNQLTGPLIGGRLYQLTIQHNTLANVLQQEEVPEPATLAILAGGLLSMSLVSRRRKS